jgi:hypothetical protein
MDCTEVKELLSAYHDGELGPDDRSAVAEHLRVCHDCAGELEGFRCLSALAEGLVHPDPPQELWPRIKQQLAGEEIASTKHSTLWDWQRWARRPALHFGLAAVAAIVLIAVGLFGTTDWFGHRGDHEFTAVFGRYLEAFQADPHDAQEILLAHYPGQAVQPAQAAQIVGYRPAIASGMPDGYSVESAYVMKMPCCTCVQCLCRRGDGTTMAIFEHDDDEMQEWFGDRPETSAVCNGAPCRLVALDGRIAASWKQGERHITVVGARDIAEVGDLVAWFGERHRVGPL